jgi:DnaJ-class molecular chaperone
VEGLEMDKKIFVPEKYGMEICPGCNSHGYNDNPERHPCPKCGGFGFTKMKTKQNIQIINGKSDYDRCSQI